MPDRKIIVVGCRKGELLPPYGNTSHINRPVEKSEAERILKYIKGKNPVKSEISVYDSNYRLYFKSLPGKVEIVGSWLECCVEQTAEFFLRKRSEVLINPRLVLSNKKRTAEEISDYLMSALPLYSRRTRQGLVFGAKTPS